MKLKDTCSLEGKLNLDSILKSQDTTLPTKVHIVKTMVFPGFGKEISPECSLEGLMLKLKLQYFGRLMRRTNSLKKNVAPRSHMQVNTQDVSP